jgi:hypothetical protein
MVEHYVKKTPGPPKPRVCIVPEKHKPEIIATRQLLFVCVGETNRAGHGHPGTCVPVFRRKKKRSSLSIPPPYAPTISHWLLHLLQKDTLLTVCPHTNQECTNHCARPAEPCFAGAFCSRWINGLWEGTVPLHGCRNFGPRGQHGILVI